jgi:FemAB-related protein (PEP-CTERM system-associated)
MATSESPIVLAEAMAARLPHIRVCVLEADAHARWDSFVLNHPKGTFFHQTAWMRVIARTYGFQPYYFYAESDGQITGIAPMFLVSNWLSGRCLISLPFAVYGGVCATNADSEEALLKHIEQLASEERVKYVELRSRDGNLRPGYYANTRYATFTIPLGGDPEKLYSAFPKNVRYMIRKGEKANLRVRTGSDQLEGFYHLMTINLRRLGTPAFPLALFKNLIFEYKDQIDLTVIYHEDKAVAGGMSFRFRDCLQPYYIGSLQEAKSVAANDFLWWKLIEKAARFGCRTFDFGRSKKGSGNFTFKEKWNPVIETLNYQTRLVGRKDVPNFSPTNPKFELATTIWKKLPLGLTRAVGPHVVRWFP